MAGTMRLHFVKCVYCGQDFETKAYNAKTCKKEECQNKADTERKRKSLQKKAEDAINGFVRKSEARQTLIDLGFESEHVIDIFWKQVERVAPLLKMGGVSRVLVHHGPHIAAEIERRKQEDEAFERLSAEKQVAKVKENGTKSIRDFSPDEDAEIVYFDGELVSSLEIFALWSAFAGFYSVYENRQQTSPEQFNEFVRLRHECKTNVIALGRILGKDFYPSEQHPGHHPHEDWAKFLPSFDPDSLQPDYNEEDIKAWLGLQQSQLHGDFRNYLLMCARNHYKSSFVLVWALTPVLCCPDIRILLCSISKDMAKGFLDSFQSYWTWGKDPALEQFQRLFPEYMKEAKDMTEKVFISPMSHITRPQKTAQITSLETGDTGSRFDILIGDDVIDENGSKQPEQRDKAAASYDEKWRFREARVGFTITVGTPKHPEDLYARLVERAKKERIAKFIASAWTVKDPATQERLKLKKTHPRYLDIHNLKSEDVEVLFPSRWPFEALMEELGTDPKKERTFRSEYLIEWIGNEEDEVLAFKEEKLRQALILHASVPDGWTVLCFDTAREKTRYADNSSITALRLVRLGGRWVVVVLDQDAGRWDIDEKAEAAARFFALYNPSHFWIEKPADWDSLAQKIWFEFARRGLGHPRIELLSIDNSKDAKFYRVKACADLIPDQLKFQSGGSSVPYIDPLFAEAGRLDGKGTKMTTRNDRWDSIALGVKKWKPFLEQLPVSDSEQESELAAQPSTPMRLAVYETVFGDVSPQSAERERANWEGRELFRVYQETGQVEHKVPVVEEQPQRLDPRGVALMSAARKIFGDKTPFRV